MERSSNHKFETVRNMAQLTVLMALLAVSLAFIWRLSIHRPSDRVAVSLETRTHTVGGAPALGSTSASVAIVEFADFECGFCAQFAMKILPELRKRYIDTKKVLFVFRQFPIAALHPTAAEASAAATCAEQQGHFWDMHNSLFAKPRSEAGWQAHERARAIGLDLKRFESCMATDGPIAVKADLTLGDELGIIGTPTFIIGVLSPTGTMRSLRRISGTKPVDVFAAALDEVIR